MNPKFAPDIDDGSDRQPSVVTIGSKDLLDGWTWTKTKPKKCGYYWVKGKSPHHNPRILRFGVLAITGKNCGIQPQSGPLSTEGWEWFCGPIPKPSND